MSVVRLLVEVGVGLDGGVAAAGRHGVDRVEEQNQKNLLHLEDVQLHYG